LRRILKHSGHIRDDENVTYLDAAGYNRAEGFQMGDQYVEQRDGAYYVAGSRVSLDSVVYAFLRGESPDGIVESFPSLSLEQAYGAIAYYLAHQQAIDTYLEQGRAEFERMREESRRKHPALYAKLDAARRSMPGPRA
jgi:uncharacterized protein (DUF433 family)